MLGLKNVDPQLTDPSRGKWGERRNRSFLMTRFQSPSHSGEEEGYRQGSQVFEYGLLGEVHNSSCSRGRVARPGDESGTALSVVLRVQEYFQSSTKSGPPPTLEALACRH